MSDEPLKCSWCGLPLPITLASADDPKAVSVACASCGSRLRARVWEAVPEQLKGNIRIETKGK